MEEVFAVPDGLFPKITNLEYFPVEILLNIFTLVDDDSLLKTSFASTRFELIVQAVIKERYANEHFVIASDSEKRREQCHALLSHFGGNIKGVSIHGVRNIDEHHWMIEMLNAYTTQIKRLQFFECHFKNAENILSHHLDVTHLTFQKCTADAINHMPNFCHLRHFEARDFIDIENSSYEQIIRNNPQLESLVASNSNEDPLQIIMAVEKYSKHLKKLHLTNDSESLQFSSARLTDQFMHTTNQLESLGISICNHSAELLRMLSTHCRNVKCFEVVHTGGDLSNEVIEALRSFKKITKLSLTLTSYEDDIDSLLKSFPKLRELSITLRLEMPPTSDFLLSLLRECPELRRITVNSIKRQYWHSFNEMFHQDGYDDEIEDDHTLEHMPDTEDNPIKRNINVRFHNEFVDITRNRFAKLELKENSKTISIVSNYKILWRNMLIHWKCYDAVYNRSGKQLLDLANSEIIPPAKQKQPFDIILGYLDLNSLYSLYNTCKRSRELVKNYVQKQSAQQGKFVITDEFDINYDSIRTFGQYIYYLEAHLLNDDDILPALIKQCCKNLKKLSLNQACKYHKRVYRYRFIFPQLRHFIYESANARTYFNLSKLPVKSLLETLEFKSDVWLRNSDYEPNLFRNLKKIKFNGSNATITSFAKNIPHIEVICDS